MAARSLLGLLAALLFVTPGMVPAGGMSRSSASPVSLTQPTLTPSAASGKLRKPRLPIHRNAPLPANRAAPSLLKPLPARSLNAIFNGLNQPGLNTLDNGAFQSAPPDTTGSIGPNHYVEMVNSVIGVYNRNDLSLVTKATFNTWLGVGFSAFPCDPQMQWDSSSQRWLYVVLECNFGLDKFLFGWSKTADPSDLVNGWCRFSRNTPGVLTDYPKLGHNSKYMLIGTNNYSDPNTFLTAEIFWMRTPDPGVTSCSAPTVNSKGTQAQPLKNGNGTTLTSTPVPVNTSTNAADGYVVSAYDPFGPPAIPQSKLAVWHLDTNGVLIQHPDINVTTYSIPNAAPNLGGSAFGIDTLDGRLTQAVGDPITGIYAQHTVNGAGGRSKVTWYEIQAPSSVPALTQQGDISSSTEFVFNGSISPRSDGEGAVIFYNRSSASTRVVIATLGRMNRTPLGQMDPGEIVLATSTAGDNDFTCNYMGGGFPCRWGDYSGASPDPVFGNVVWGSNQGLTTPSGPGNPNWVTQNYAIVGPVVRAGAHQSSPLPTPSRDPANPGSAPATPNPR